MSFVKKAVKKVFKFVKRKIKKTISFTKRLLKNKYFQIAVIIAASVFTAGLAAGGFAAFSGVSSVGGFFSAVGTTMSTGFSAIGSVLTGAKSFAAAFPAISGAAPAAVAGTTANTTGVLAANAGVGTMATAGAGTGAAAAEAALAGGAASGMTTSALASAGVGSAATTGISAATATGASMTAAQAANAGWTVANAGTGVGASAAPTGFLSKVGNLLVDKGWKGTMARTGIMAGIQGYYKQKELDKQEYYYRNRTVWGKAAFGSGNSQGLNLLFPQYSNNNFASASTGGKGLLSPDSQSVEAPNVYQGADQVAQEQGTPGVPSQITQPPPGTQPNQGLPSPGVQLENMGVA